MPTETRSRLDMLVRNTPGMVWAYYFDGRPNFVSRGCCGYTVREWREGGLDFLVSVHGLRSQYQLLRAFYYAITLGESVTNVRLSAADGVDDRSRFFRVAVEPVFRDKDQIVGLQGIHLDLTEFRATQQALRESRARFNDIAESAHELVWSVDRRGHWTYLNQAARQVYGEPPGDLLDRPLVAAALPDFEDNDRQVLRQVLGGKTIIEHETMHLRSDGSERCLSFNLRPRVDKDGRIYGAAGTARDITEQKYYQRQLEHLAEHDMLTGLYNRHYVEQELERAVARLDRKREVSGLFYLDLDNFKYINDTLGHLAGDRLLVELSQLLQERIRQGDTLARFGGDEFVVLTQDTDAATLQRVAEELRRLVDGFVFSHDGKPCHIGVSIGATLIDDRTAAAGDFLARADVACNLAKREGRDRVHIYHPADAKKVGSVTGMGWSQKIKQALEHDRLALIYQPIVRMTDNEVVCHEVLLRMQGADGALIAPSAFLPAAERFGLMDAIDSWVVEAAMARLGALYRQGLAQQFSINLSGYAFHNKGLLSTIHGALERHDLDPSVLTFEITEAAVAAQIADAKEFIQKIRDLGCSLTLDGFGSGFGPLNNLKYLPVDSLKIDGGLVKNLARDAVDQAMVRSMSQVARALGKKTIASFVEDKDILRLVRDYGVDYAQGYYLGRPTEEVGERFLQ